MSAWSGHWIVFLEAHWLISNMLDIEETQVALVGCKYERDIVVACFLIHCKEVQFMTHM